MAEVVVNEGTVDVSQREPVKWKNSRAPVMLMRITVSQGRLVDYIVFEYTDGSSTTYGQPGGEETSSFELDYSRYEYVVRVNGRQGSNLDGIQFVTNLGRSSRWFGGGGGIAFQHTVDEGDMLFQLLVEDPQGWCPLVNGVLGTAGPKLPRRRSLTWLVLNRHTMGMTLSGSPSILRMFMKGRPSVIRLSLRGNPSVFRMMFQGKNSLIREMLTGEEKRKRNSLYRVLCTPGNFTGSPDISIMRLILTASRDRPSIMAQMFQSKPSVVRLFLGKPKSDLTPLHEMLFQRDMVNGHASVMRLVFERDVDQNGEGFPSVMDAMLIGEEDTERECLLRLLLNGSPSLMHLLLEGEDEGKTSIIRAMVEDRHNDGLSVTRRVLTGFDNHKGHRPALSTYFVLGEERGRTSILRNLVSAESARDQPSLLRLMLLKFQYEKKARKKKLFRMGSSMMNIKGVKRFSRSRSDRNKNKNKNKNENMVTDPLVEQEKMGVVEWSNDEVIVEDDEFAMNEEFYEILEDEEKSQETDDDDDEAGYALSRQSNTVSKQVKVQSKAASTKEPQQPIEEVVDDDGEEKEIWRKKSIMEIMMAGEPSILDLMLDGELTGEDSLARLMLATTATFINGRIVLGEVVTARSRGLSLFKMMLIGEEEGGPGLSFLRMLLMGEEESGFSVMRLLLLNETTDEPSILRILMTTLKTILVASKQRKGDMSQWRGNLKQLITTITTSQKKKKSGDNKLSFKNLINKVTSVVSSGLVNYKELISIISTIPQRNKEFAGLWKMQFLRVARELEKSSNRSTFGSWPEISLKWSKLAEDIAYQRWTQVLQSVINVGVDIGTLLPEAMAVYEDEMKTID